MYVQLILSKGTGAVNFNEKIYKGPKLRYAFVAQGTEIITRTENITNPKHNPKPNPKHNPNQNPKPIPHQELCFQSALCFQSG